MHVNYKTIIYINTCTESAAAERQTETDRQRQTERERQREPTRIKYRHT